MTVLRTLRIVAWTLVAVVAVAIIAVIAFQSTQVTPSIATATIGGPFELSNQRGEIVTEAALRGSPSAIFFGYTFCPDVCPTTLLEMSGWLKELGTDADKLKVYFVTVDPERDTADQIASHLEAFDPRIIGLTGPRDEVEQMLKAYRIFWRKVPIDGGEYIMDHSASVYLFDSNGILTSTVDLKERPETVLQKLRKLVAGV
jgi:protein SCO1/2